MKVQVSDFNSYRAARVKSMFNVDSGCDFTLDAHLAIDGDWRIGVVVGPSGSGKTSIGREIFEGNMFWEPEWPHDAPVIDGFSEGIPFDDITAALSGVGLGSVPAWLRPHAFLSNGEKFRADLARLVCEAPARAVVDEFTSVVDRQIVRVGAAAFAKAWRRNEAGQVVLLTPHYDILEWIGPDWVFDTARGEFVRGRCLQRPDIHLDIRETDWRYWPAFEPHHYLKLPRMIAATCYVGVIDGERVCHVAVSTTAGMKRARPARLVVKPEWQGDRDWTAIPERGFSPVGERRKSLRQAFASGVRHGAPRFGQGAETFPDVDADIARGTRTSIGCPLNAIDRNL